MVSSKNGYFKITGLDIYNDWNKFQKTIPFTSSYGHLSYSWNPKTLTLKVEVITRRSKCFEVVEKWFKEQQSKVVNKGDADDKI